MKCKKIALLGCGAIFFVAASQLISCGGGGGGGGGETDYTVSISSPSLQLEKTTAKKGTDFETRISIKAGSDNSLIVPHTLTEVTIGGQKAEVGTKYTYTVENNSSAKLTISAANLTGNVVITAEPDKTTKSVGDYAHLYVNDKSVSFDIENVQVGEYFVYAVTESGQALSDIKYYDGGTEKVPQGPTIEIQNAGTVKVVFSYTNNIEDYVTAAMLKVVTGTSSRFNLSTSYNGRGVAFKYKLPISGGANFSAIPIIANGAERLSETPKGLKKLLDKPTILNIASTSIKQTLLEKKGTAHPYYVADSGSGISLTGFNLFLGYFNGIHDDNEMFEISSLIKNNTKYNISATGTHDVFIDTPVDSNTNYFAYNASSLPLHKVYDGTLFESLPIEEGYAFTSWENKSVFVNYELNTGDVLGSYDVGIYKKEIVRQDVKNATLNVTPAYANKGYVFGSSETNQPIVSMDITGNNPYYSYIMKIGSTSHSPMLDNDNIFAYGSEVKNDGTISRITIKFALIASDRDDYSNYTFWYAPIMKDGLNYLSASNSTISVKLNFAAIKFNENVINDTVLTFSAVTPIGVISFINPDVHCATISNNGSLNWKNAFSGVPYTCQIKPKSEYYRNLTKEHILLKENGAQVSPDKFSFGDNLLKFDPTGRLEVALNKSADEKVAYVQFGNPSPSKCMFKNGTGDVPLHTLNDSEVVLVSVNDTQVSKENITKSDFSSSYNDGTHPVTSIEPDDINISSDKKSITLKYNARRVDDDGHRFVFDRSDLLDSYWE